MQTFSPVLGNSIPQSLYWIGGAFFLAIAVIYLLIGILGTRQRLKREAQENQGGTPNDRVTKTREKELEWYREKRFLMERQAREKHSRLESLVESTSPEKSHRLTYSATRLFFLADSIREERQHLGTDISKLTMVERRLRELSKDCMIQSEQGPKTQEWISEMNLCRNMIQESRDDLRKAQNSLRAILGDVVKLEGKAQKNDISDSEMPMVIALLKKARRRISELPDGMRTIAKSSAERADLLFKDSINHIPDEGLHAIWKEQLSLDLFSSKHRSGGRSELLSAAESAISSVHSVTLNKGKLSNFWNDEERGKKSQKTTSAKSSETKIVQIDPEPITTKAAKDKDRPKIISIDPPVELDKLAKAESAKEEGPTQDSESTPAGGYQFGSSQAKSLRPKNTDAKSDETGGYQFRSASTESSSVTSKTHAGVPDAKAGYQFGEKDSEPPAKEEKVRVRETATAKSEKPGKTDAIWVTPLDFGLSEIEDHPKLVEKATEKVETSTKAEDASEPNSAAFNPFDGQEFASGDTSQVAVVDPSDSSELIVFRSSDPEIWNTNTNQGENRFARTVSDISGNVQWLGIKRMDTGDEVFCEINLEDLKHSGDGKAAGFNGSNEFFYGARHLGMFSEDCPTEVETRFTYGGWGFGHLSTSDGDDDNPIQICGWNGKRIPDSTIFEFTLYEYRPDRALEHQVII